MLLLEAREKKIQGLKNEIIAFSKKNISADSIKTHITVCLHAKHLKYLTKLTSSLFGHIPLEAIIYLGIKYLYLFWVVIASLLTLAV